MKTSKRQKDLKLSMLKGIICSLFLFFSLPLFAQNITITGKVTSSDGEEIIGANVLIKSVARGTITDIDGNYVLENVPTDAQLEFSYLGMTPKLVKVNNRTRIDVVLQEDSELLDEVVVTALGMKREQKALGYAVTEVKGDDLKMANTISPVSSLQGKVAGVEISNSDGGMFGAAKIQIRGASTLSGNNQPIYVVDGVILDNNTSGNTDLNWGANANDYGNELKNLNPDDFESVSVLKGAAATALYGSRGLNGAVVITTKSGQGAKGIGVSLSQTFGFDVNVKYPGAQYEYGYGYFPGLRTGFAEGNADNKWDPNTMFTNTDGVQTYRNAPGLGLGFGPRFDCSEIENFDGTMTRYAPYKNGVKDFYQTGFNSNTNVSVRGGNETTTFYSSLSYKNAESTIKNNTFERYSWMMKASHKITDKVNIEGSINFAHSKPRNAAPEIGLYSVYSGIYNFDKPGLWKNKYKGNHGGLANSKYGDEYGLVPGTVKSIWWNIDHANSTHKEYVIRPSLEVTYDILKWLSFKAEANMNLYKDNFENKSLGSGYENEGGGYGISSYLKEQLTTAGTFTAHKDLGDFTLGGFLRGEFYAQREQFNSAQTQGGLVVPGQYFIENSKDRATFSGKVSGTKRMASLVFAVNASWKDQLFLDVTGRNDWSSALVYSNSTGNNSYFYPSVSGSWLMHNSIKLPEWFTFAKLRGSWAQVGNDTNPYRINQGFNLTSIPTAAGNIYTNDFSSQSMYDLDLKPERKNAWELGLDFRFIQNRIGLDATYYRENTKDQILSIDVPSVSGIQSKLVNAGNIQNTGIELALKTVPVRTNDWEWGVDFTYTRNKSKIVSLHPDVAGFVPLEGQVNAFDFRVGSVAQVGGEYGLLMSDILPKRDEETGQVLLRWIDGFRAAFPERDGTVKKVGSMNPKYLTSMSTTLTWKNLSLRVALDARVGGYVASYANRYGTNLGNTKTSLRYRDPAHGGMTWTSQWMDNEKTPSGSYGIEYQDGLIPEGIFRPGTEITCVDGVKRDVSGRSYRELYEEGLLEPMHAGAYHFTRNDWGVGTINDDWFHKLSYVALREVTLAYRFDKKIANKIGAQGLSMSFTGRNLGYLYNSLPNNLNPESVRGNRAGEFRIRSFNPYTASFIFSMNVDF